MRPTLNIEVLKQRYKVIRFCTSSRNIEVVENFVTSLRNINNVKVSSNGPICLRLLVTDIDDSCSNYRLFWAKFPSCKGP